MTKAFDYGATRLWVVNVGDLKPAEAEIEFAMDLAWNVSSGRRKKPIFTHRTGPPEHSAPNSPMRLRI